MSIEAMNQALDALVKSKKALEVLWVSHHANRTDYAIEDIESAIKALRAAIQQAEAQQPATGEPMLSTDIAPRPLSYSLDDYHRAPSEGALHYTWQDKPHRLLYDLIAAVAYYAGKQPVTTEPVARVDYSERGNIAWLFGPQLPDGTELFKRPAPSAPATGEPVVVQHRKPVIGWKGETIGYTGWRDGKGLDGWPHRELYTHPAPGVPDDVVRNSERYRWLRNEANFTARVAPQVCMLDCLTAQASALHAEAVDAAIDAAMLAAK